MADGGYSARNGARDAPQHRQATDGSALGEDFPMLCETCLGPNPYVRMTKLPYGHKLCKISNIPFQAFKWKAGPGGRYKETIISYAVAAERNVCQCCLNDMVYGLPVGVRDAILSRTESSSDQIALPQSNVGQQYFYEQQAQMIASGQVVGNNSANNMLTDLANVAKSRQLDKFSRALQVAEAKSKVAFRNLPKLCSFWLNGACTRVLRKTCPFRPCCGVYAFPEIAGSARELCAQLVKDLEEKGPAEMQKELGQETRDAIQQALRGNRDDAIRSRIGGKDDLTKKYLGKMKNMRLELDPPADRSIITLWMGGIEPDTSEEDLRAVIYPYGQIASIHMVRSAKCAFVEYADREAAEQAASQLYKALMVNGRPVNVNWAKPRVEAAAAAAGGALGDMADGDASAAPVLLPPPGMERAPASAYCLPGMAPPPPPPPLPTGAPPSKRQKVDGASSAPAPPPARSLAATGFSANFSGYGDSDDEESGAGAAAGAGASNSSCSSAAGGGSSAGGGRGAAAKPSGSFAHKPPMMKYPSMNPARMGSKA